MNICIISATEIEETQESDEVEQTELGVAEMDDLVETDKEAVHEINILMLKHVEALQERMISASLQVKVEVRYALLKFPLPRLTLWCTLVTVILQQLVITNCHNLMIRM